MADVISLDTIARQASAAAAQWERGTPPPSNPYDEHLQPEHAAEWSRRFWLAVGRQPVVETEGGA